MAITQRKRITEKWWFEPGERELLEEQARLKEAYDPNRLRPGWSGKDAPAAEEMGSGYASKTDGKYDKLGASQGTKTKKGDGQKADYPDVKEKTRRIVMVEDEFGTEEMGGGMGGGEPNMMDDGLNPESEIPPEMEGDELEGEDAEQTAEEVTVEIGGKQFKLVPVEGEEGMEGEEEMMGDEQLPPEGPEGAEDLGGVAAENKDVTVQEKTRRRVREDESALSGTPAAGGDFMGEQDYDKLLDSAIAEVSKKTEKSSVKENEIRKLIQMRKYAEKKLVELFTGEYVMNKQGEPGFDFTDVTGDKDFAVIDRAASGRQYSPTVSKSVWEPEEKGGKTEHAKKAENTKKPAPKNQPPQKRPVSRKEQFQVWLKKYSTPLKEDEKDPGEDSEAFNKEDLFGVVNSISPMDPERYPEIPEIMGKEPDLLSQYKKTQERRKVRRAQEVVKQQLASKSTAKQPVKETAQPETTGPFNFLCPTNLPAFLCLLVL